jgi:hypothetical protein
MTARPDPFRIHVADQVPAALAEAVPLPLSAPDVEKRTGYGRRNGQVVCTVLARLAACGEVEKIAAGRQARLLAAAPSGRFSCSGVVVGRGVR